MFVEQKQFLVNELKCNKHSEDEEAREMLLVKIEHN